MMPRRRQPYPAEYRQRLVELFRKGRSAEDLARHFEPSAEAIRKSSTTSRAGTQPSPAALGARLLIAHGI